MVENHRRFVLFTFGWRWRLKRLRSRGRPSCMLSISQFTEQTAGPPGGNKETQQLQNCGGTCSKTIHGSFLLERKMLQNTSSAPNIRIIQTRPEAPAEQTNFHIVMLVTQQHIRGSKYPKATFVSSPAVF